ncbi:type IV secretion system DNA-binding domain-containing protein [Oscillatoriales cyanobacterium LEGE 11467]|uniref:Type IV secretion system DNA-binding domain-containing protein n=1 Tax=Zarconia navalis LEGE 11467 TaxID=1828826 RepID=A0A928VTX8_9CYAN|nr:type IV secretion system DNA-binding domain-containing protein [Zarconia navalis]MBE9040197.1 type IV secretion system DNA-binding domain-containing protein [Zarconia navalis LEGE 11467]
MTPKTLEGTKQASPAEFNREVKGDGIGIPCTVNGKTEFLKIPSDKERYHLMLAGDSGTGKTVLLNHLLLQVRARGEFAIVYDPSLQFWSRLGKPGDILLHPLYDGCPSWNIADEITNPLNATAVAKSFLPDSSSGDEDEDFFKWSPQVVFQAMLLRLKREGKGTPELLQWLRNPEEIERTVKGSEDAYLIDREAAEQRWGVLGSLSRVGKLLRLLPTTGASFSFGDWSRNRTGWIFIGSRGEEERDALRPLISAWLDIALGKLMLDEDERAPPTWVIVDELPTLKKLPKLQSAITEGRKYNLRFCLGFEYDPNFGRPDGVLAILSIRRPHPI